jgi:hypothetical protein
MANERLIKDLRKLRDDVARRMNSKARLYSKSPGNPERDVTDEQMAADRATVEELERIIESASRD